MRRLVEGDQGAGAAWVREHERETRVVGARDARVLEGGFVKDGDDLALSI